MPAEEETEGCLHHVRLQRLQSPALSKEMLLRVPQLKDSSSVALLTVFCVVLLNACTSLDFAHNIFLLSRSMHSGGLALG